jgi:hypothetical protein
MGRHVTVRWADAANLRAKRALIERELANLQPRVERDIGTAGIIVDLDIPDEGSSTDQEAAQYAVKVLTDVLGHDDDAGVIGVALDSTTEPEISSAQAIDAAPARTEDPNIVDVEEVALDEDDQTS